MSSTSLKIAKSSTSVTGHVLVVDDHAQARESVADVLRHSGYQVDCLASAIEALNKIGDGAYDVVITDLQMPGMDGLQFIRQLAERRHGAQIVMVTAHATIASAVEAMRHGAFDYIEKPFDADRLEQLVGRAIRHGQMLDAGAATSAIVAPAGASMIGESRAMQELRLRIAQVAPTSETVLIVGESGTGKELVARALHAQSNRATAPLISLNCPVLSAQLMESELFGHERGAFTGADNARTGRFELADGGTILLDEITEIDLPLQAKLLRVLQQRNFERVGSSQTIDVDVRVLATTNRDLRSEIAAGRFREDLYYRLAVVPLVVPPLRNRREDVPLLVEHFLAQAAARLKRPPCDLQNSARQLLAEYHWPGNVRELENIVTRASVLHGARPATADDLRPWLIGGAELKPNRGTPTDAAESTVNLQDMERKLIEETLDRFGGHRARTAEALGIGIRTLSGKLKLYGYAPRSKNWSRAA